ncbi:hypothetical protein HY636_02035 [Candidatus Woesearchaeota archaeon]|nr:hypothetical protein [Candidatus Woesearchaeota archaeon]
MTSQSYQTQTGKTISGKYECVVVKLGEVYIVTCPGDVMDNHVPTIRLEEGTLAKILAAKPSFPTDPEPKQIQSRYYGCPYLRIGADDFKSLEAFQDAVRGEVNSLEGRLGEGETLSLDKIRTHLTQKPQYAVLINYERLPNQLTCLYTSGSFGNKW